MVKQCYSLSITGRYAAPSDIEYLLVYFQKNTRTAFGENIIVAIFFDPYLGVEH